MRAFEGIGVPRASGGTLLFGLIPSPALAQCDAELRSPTDAELCVDASEVGLDGLLAQEERRGDLAVGPSRGRQLRDARLGLGQVCRCAAADRHAPELFGRTRVPEAQAVPLEQRQRLVEGILRGTPLAAPAEYLALRQQRAAEIDRQRERSKRRDRALRS